MLSSRGRKYAALDLAAGYKKDRGQLYDPVKHPNGLISFANAENFLMRDEALDYIKTKCIPSVEPESLTYHDGPFGSKRLRQAMASFINSRFAPCSAVNKDQITFISGVTALNDILSLCMTDGEDEGLLLGMPVYGSFAPDFQSMSNCKLVYTPFRGVNQFGVGAVECYERALQDAAKNGIKVKGLVLANPHNPLGQCYSREALEAILRFCMYDVGESLPGFTSILSLDTAEVIDKNLVHVMYGMAKDFAAAGLRLGCLITRNEELGNAVQSLARFHGASPMTGAIATAMLEDKQWHTQFIAKSARLLGEHRKIAIKELDAAGIPYNRKANAGFFLWIDLSACLSAQTWEAEDELKLKLYNFGLEMAAGRGYHDEVPGNFRFLFSVDRDTLEEALRRVVKFYEINRLDRS